MSVPVVRDRDRRVAYVQVKGPATYRGSLALVDTSVVAARALGVCFIGGGH